MSKNKTSRKIPEKLVDSRGQFEIFPNGHPNFMTKSARNKFVESALEDRERGTFEPVSEESLR